MSSGSACSALIPSTADTGFGDASGQGLGNGGGIAIGRCIDQRHRKILGLLGCWPTGDNLEQFLGAVLHHWPMARGHHPVGETLPCGLGRPWSGGYWQTGSQSSSGDPPAGRSSPPHQTPHRRTGAPQRICRNKEFGHRGRRWPIHPDSGGWEWRKLQDMALPQIQGIIATANHPHPGDESGSRSFRARAAGLEQTTVTSGSRCSNSFRGRPGWG
jgi:hypothetical protein